MWVWVYVGSWVSGKVVREGLPGSGILRDGLAGGEGREQWCPDAPEEGHGVPVGGPGWWEEGGAREEIGGKQDRKGASQVALVVKNLPASARDVRDVG